MKPRFWIHCLLAATIVATAIIHGSAATQTGPSLVGVWQVIEYNDPVEGNNTKPQPALYIFTKGYYSIVEVQGRTERPDPPADLGKASAAEILAVFGSTFRSQAGTYEAVNGRISFGTIVSKSPVAMKRSTPLRGTYQFAGPVLVLTTGQTTRKLKRVE